MPGALLALSLGVVILTSAACHAGGFFRRVPEVGEWARYELTMQLSSSNPRNDREHSSDSTGSLILKCVGTELIDQVPHTWLEGRLEIMDGMNVGGGSKWAVAKVLVPNDHVIEADLADHISRGWAQSSRQETYELSENANHDRFAGGTVIYLAFEDSRELEAGSRERTVTFDGQDIMLTRCESGALPTFPYDGVTLSGNVSWWPSDELAFGIAAAEHVEVFTFSESGIENRMTTTMQIELVETGTGAVSDLPDHN